jgi:hypothetical protein
VILQFARELGETSDQVGAQPNSDVPPNHRWQGRLISKGERKQNHPFNKVEDLDLDEDEDEDEDNVLVVTSHCDYH